MIEVDIVTDAGGVEQLRADWQACFEQSRAAPYACFDWFSLYLAHFGAASKLRIAVARVDGRPGAILPLERVAARIGPLREQVLQFCADGFSPWTTGIFAAGVDVDEVTSACLSALRSADSTWAFMRLSKVPADPPPGARFHRSGMPGSIQIVLPDSWEAYLQALPGSRRYGINRRVKRLSSQHEVALLRVGLDAGADQSRLRRAMDAALEISASSWQGRAGEGMAISDDTCRPFFIEVSERMAAQGALDLSVLFVDERPVSFLWGAARGASTSISKLGFDADYAALSPGRAHIAMHIEDSIRRGLGCIDFGHEFAGQKRQWSDHELPLCELWYFPPGIKSSLYRSWYRLRRGVR